jgi:hypothetical protein
MPIHLTDLDVVSEAEGLSSALIVPCNMCPAVSVAVDRKQPFMKLFRSWLRSAPFERHIETLRSRLAERGVTTEVFRNPLYRQWFMCMWTEGRRRRLRKRAKPHDAVIVLGCDTANETVREAVEPTRVRVIEGMQVAGLMNARLSFRLPGTVDFEGCRIIPLPRQA